MAFITFFIAVLVSLPSFSFAGDLVQWKDEKGMIHFSDSLSNVPTKYRGQAKLEKFSEEKSPQRARLEAGYSDSEGGTAGILGEKPKSNSYEVPFEAYEGAAQRVIVSVTFNDSVTVPMLIDTGAPGLVISPRLAKQLGVFSNDEGMVVTMTGGIGGKVPAIRTFIDKVQVGGAKDSFIPATVTPSISGSYEGLIGMDFMSKYSLKIDPVKQVVIFEEISLDPKSPGGRNERWWRSLFKELHFLRAAWKNYSERLGKMGAITQNEIVVREFADRQAKEADKLISRLDRHASEYLVPQSWR